MNEWPKVALGEICELTGGGTPSRSVPAYFGGSVPWITPTDVTKLEGRYLNGGKESITETGLAKSSAKLLPENSVLLTSRATIGFTAINSVPVTTNQGFANFICGPRVIPDFLAYVLEWMRDYLVGLASGATFKEISKSTLKRVEIPLPPLEEQRRIVALLDRAAEIRRRAEAARDKARAIIPALFVDMFGDPATNPMGWDVVELGEVAKVSGGGTPSKSNKGFWSGSIPWVSPKDMKFDLIEDSQDKISDEAVRGSAVKIIPPHAVLIVVRGMILAHTVPISMNTVPVTLNQDMKAITPSASVDPVYLRWSLQVSRPYLLSKVETSAHGTRKLETPVITGFQLQIPPLALQKKFSEIANQVAASQKRIATADKLSQNTQTALSAEVFA